MNRLLTTIAYLSLACLAGSFIECCRQTRRFLAEEPTDWRLLGVLVVVTVVGTCVVGFADRGK